MKYKESDLRELCRVDRKYWETGNTDILDRRTNIAQRISNKYWSEVLGIVAFANKTGKPIDTVISVLALYGFEMEQEDE